MSNSPLSPMRQRYSRLRRQQLAEIRALEAQESARAQGAEVQVERDLEHGEQEGESRRPGHEA